MNCAEEIVNYTIIDKQVGEHTGRVLSIKVRCSTFTRACWFSRNERGNYVASRRDAVNNTTYHYWINGENVN